MDTPIFRNPMQVFKASFIIYADKNTDFWKKQNLRVYKSPELCNHHKKT